MGSNRAGQLIGASRKSAPGHAGDATVKAPPLPSLRQPPISCAAGAKGPTHWPTMPSPPSTRRSDAWGRQSFAFASEDYSEEAGARSAWPPTLSRVIRDINPKALENGRGALLRDRLGRLRSDRAAPRRCGGNVPSWLKPERVVCVRASSRGEYASTCDGAGPPRLIFVRDRQDG